VEWSGSDCFTARSRPIADAFRNAGREEGFRVIYVGIDNGISGGLAAISDHPGVDIIAMLPMPVSKARKGNEVNIRAIHLWLSETTGGNLSNAVYVVEEPGGSKSAKAAASMTGSFHALRGFFETKFLRWERITPKAWQRKLIPGCKTGDTKARALEAAGRIWPHETFLASPRCRVPHDGLIDAALIAEFGRRSNL